MANASSDRGGGWVAAQAVLMVAVLVLGGTHGHQWWSPPLFAVAGALSILGAILGIWGVKALGRSRTPYPKPVEGGVLVQTGPYAIVRHPLYASVILLSFAWGLFLSSAPSLVVSGILTLFFQAKAAREEQWLRATYPGYDAYTRRVKRLIPWVW